MVFSRIKTNGWAVNEKAKSSQLNQLDLDHSKALDKTTDTVAGGGGITGPVDLASSGTLTAKSGSHTEFANGCNLAVDGYCNATLNLQGGGSQLAISNGGSLFIDQSAPVAVTLGSGSNVFVASGANLTATGTGKIKTQTAGAIQLGGGSSDWVSFSTPRTITRVFAATPAARVFSGGGITSGSFIQGNASGTAFSTIIPVPHNATLNSVTAYVRIVNSHVSLPTNGPGMSIQKIDPTTQGLTTFLNGADAGDGLEIKLALPANVGLYNGLGVTSWTYTCNQNNTIDKTADYYLVAVYDESGGGASSGNIFSGFSMSFTLSDHEIA